VKVEHEVMKYSYLITLKYEWLNMRFYIERNKRLVIANRSCINHAKTFLTSSLITMLLHGDQTGLVVFFSHTGCTHVGGPTNLGDAGAPPPWDGGVADLIETCYSPTRVITPNFVALGQTVWA